MKPVRSSATFQSLLKPLDKWVWVTLAGWVIGMTLILFMGNKVRMRYGLLEKYFSPTFLNMMYFILQSLCQQGG